MKRDMDLVRKILFECEKSPGGFVDHLVIEGHDDEEVGYHIYLMGQAGLVEMSERTHMGSNSPIGMVKNITWEGHEFLDAARSETVWSKAKAAALAGAGGLTLGILKTAMGAVANAEVMKHLR